MTTLGERVDKVVKTFDNEIDESKRFVIDFPKYADGNAEIINSLNDARAKFISAVEALIEEYQI